MIGIVVAAHGRLGAELVATAELIVGSIPRCVACDISPDLSSSAMEEALHRAVSTVDDGDGVLVLADLIGGTPCTRSLALCERARIEVLTGVSLPMLLKAHSLRNGHGLRAVAEKLVEASRSAVRWATEGLGARSDGGLARVP